MGTLRHALALMLAGIAMPALAGPIESYEAALARGDLREAGRAADALVAAHLPADGKPRPDPFLNGVVGRLLLRGGQVAPARAYLDQARSADFSPGMANEVALARAEAQGRDGDWTAALASYRALPEAGLSPDQRRRRSYGIARQLLLESPAEAIPPLTRQLAASPAPADRWEGELLLAFAQRLTGDRRAAQAAADRAWIAAASARANDGAPSSVALGRAALMAGEADSDAMRAMLDVAGGRSATIANSVPDRLPRCGEGGVTPEDYATFAVQAAPRGSISTIAAASRPEIVPVFARAIGQVDVIDAAGSGGTVFTARCRTLPSASYRQDSGVERVWAQWSEKNGFFPSFATGADAEGIEQLSRRIAAIEQRYGRLSPMSIMPRQELLPRLAMRGDAAREQMRATAADLLDSTRALGGLEEIYPPSFDFRQIQGEIGSATPEALLATRQRLLKDMIANVGLDSAYWYGTAAVDGHSGFAPAERIAIIDLLLTRFPAGVPDRRVDALKMRKADILRDAGDRTARRALLATIGLPPSACAMMDAPPTTKTATISAADYPQGALRSALSGLSVVEYALDADGKVQHLRHIVSAPAGLFDAVVEAKLRSFSFTPARNEGRPIACEARLQRIIWNLPEQADEGGTAFAPLPLSETR